MLNMSVLFWGTGSYAERWLTCAKAYLLHIFQKKLIIRKEDIGKRFKFKDIDIITPEQLQNETFDYICILSSFDIEIRKEVNEKWNIPLELFITAPQLQGMILQELYLSTGGDFRPIFDKDFNNRIWMNFQISNQTGEKTILNSYYDFLYLKNQYSVFINAYKATTNYNIIQRKQETAFVWICWFQGLESAPPLIKACIKSIEKYCADFTVILITDNNLANYVTFPEYILQKYKKGVITKTHFSDLLRLELLTQYGGIWIDATVLMTSQLPTYVKEANLFVFSIGTDRRIEPRIASSWFIASQKGHPILQLTKDMLYNYWERYDTIINYFIFHYFFHIACDYYESLWKKATKLQNNSSQLFDILFEKFNYKQFEFICQNSFCHKLTYKISIPEQISQTYYEKIIDEFK